MRAEDLVALASAHGIDLVHCAGTSLETKKRARKRKRTAEEVRLHKDVTDTARGREHVIYVRPRWSLAELGQAACGVPDLPWLAACYSIAGDSSSTTYWTLWHGLMHELLRLERAHYWSCQVREIDHGLSYYQGRLCELVLDEDAHPRWFNHAPGLYAIHQRISDRQWERTVQERFKLVKARYELWLNVGRGMIQRWLSADDLPEDHEAERTLARRAVESTARLVSCA